jgi:ADP-heptose:LPS heptosyltransferase
MIKLMSDQHGLGDTLLFTPIVKHLKARNIECEFLLPKEKERFKILFDGLCNVNLISKEEESKIEPTKNIGYNGTYILRKLRNFFEDSECLDIRPIVLHSKKESEIWAFNFIKNIKNPVIFVPNCSKRWHDTRSLSERLSNSIINDLIKNNHTPIICDSSDNPSNLDYELKLTDLDLSKYISLLRKVGIYFGCNTGDMNLAIAVGSICHVFEPTNSAFFNKSEYDYDHPSIIYYNI